MRAVSSDLYGLIKKEDVYALFASKVQGLLHDTSWGLIYAACRYFELQTIKNLLLLSSEIRSTLLPSIQDCFTFRIMPGTIMNDISPKRIHFRFGIKLSELLGCPPNITHLSLGTYNVPIDYLPSSIQYLDLGDRFTHPIDHLPLGLTHLKIRKSYYRPIDHLPASLTHLVAIETFNMPVDYLPLNLKYLALGNRFNQPVDYLPISLQTLVIGASQFNQFMDHLPNLSQLILQGVPALNLCHLPHSIKHLECHILDADNLPSSITLLHLYGGDSNGTACDNLPTSLTHLSIFTHKPISLDHLPPNLTHLELRTYTSPELDHLPAFLTHLKLIGACNCPLDNLPNSLTHLLISNTNYSHKLDHLPSSLQQLHFCSNATSVDYLPGSLKSLIFGHDNTHYKHSLSNLPSSLTLLRLPSASPALITSDIVQNLPASLKRLKLYSPLGQEFVYEKEVLDRLKLK